MVHFDHPNPKFLDKESESVLRNYQCEGLCQANLLQYLANNNFTPQSQGSWSPKRIPFCQLVSWDFPLTEFQRQFIGIIYMPFPKLNMQPTK